MSISNKTAVITRKPMSPPDGDQFSSDSRTPTRRRESKYRKSSVETFSDSGRSSTMSNAAENELTKTLIEKPVAKKPTKQKVKKPASRGVFLNFIRQFGFIWTDNDVPKYLRLIILVKVVCHIWGGKMSVWRNQIIGTDMAKACTDQDWDAFISACKMLAICILIFIPQRLTNIWTYWAMNIKWREHITTKYLNRYFAHKNFYNATNLKDVDNPSMRILDDVHDFCNQGVHFFNEFCYAAFLGVFSGIALYQIDPMLLLCIPYSLFVTAFLLVVWGSLYFKATADKSKSTAIVRTGLVQTAEYAESVAFLNAESYEKQSALTRFKVVLSHMWRINHYESTSEATSRTFQFIYQALPYVLLLHRFFPKDGNLTVLDVTQAITAYEYMRELFELMTKIVDSDNFERIAIMAGAAIRIEELEHALDLLDANHAQELALSEMNSLKSSPRDPKDDAAMRFNNVCLSTPGPKIRNLVQDLTMSVQPGSSVIIMGPSGCGKSSLLRAICGLWQPTSGNIDMADVSTMFLPQTAYVADMPESENTLRAQLIFPNDVSDVKNKVMESILDSVNLSHLMNTGEGVNTTGDWRKLLSGGEKQRLAMARLLIAKPQMAFLDEATSALDSSNERSLYEELRNRGATYISVGHREELVKYHDFLLELKTGGGYEIRTVKRS